MRRAEPGDVETIARNHQAAWQAGYRGLIADDLLAALDLDARIDRWRRQVGASDDDRDVLVVTDDDGIWGHAAVGPASRRGDPGGEVLSLYLSPHRWGRGYGRALLHAGREWLVGRGHEHLWLWVLEGNTRAQTLYESDGWVLDGARQPVVIGDLYFGVDELQMRWTG